MNQDTYRRIVSGKDQSPRAKALLFLLKGASLLYGLIVRARNLAYSRGLLRSQAVNVPVISIGNITTGGTGKTPLVIWLCGYLAQKNLRLAILTRGYKTRPGAVTDEPALLTKACPGSHVIIDPDRCAAARRAIDTDKAQALVLDDGFQHRRLRRDLDIVAIDATCPFGHNRLLPAGLLREPVSELARASAVVITRFDQASEEQIAALEDSIRRIAPHSVIAKAAHRHTHAVTLQNKRLTLDQLKELPAFAFCGIGNPNAFYDCLKSHHINLLGTRTFNDHHAYTAAEIKDLYRQAQQSGAKAILCTQKDWVKSALHAPDKKDILFAYLAMDLEFLEGLDELKQKIDTILSSYSKQNERQTA